MNVPERLAHEMSLAMPVGAAREAALIMLTQVRRGMNFLAARGAEPNIDEINRLIDELDVLCARHGPPTLPQS